MTDPISSPAQMREAAALIVDQLETACVDEYVKLWARNRAAKIRALPVAEPEPQAVRVKPLEWQMEDGRQDDCPKWIADVDAKRYEVFKAWWGDQDKWGFVALGKFYHTEDAAKAAAEADHAARILSQIEAVSVAQVRAEALEEAAAKATSFLVGDPQNGVPLRNPMAHEIADAIRALMEKPTR